MVDGPCEGPLTASAAQFFPDIEFRPVKTVEEFTAATGLVYQEYLKCHYILPHKNHRKISLFQILPTTVTFIALHVPTQKVIATVTVAEDSPLGLPMDSLYHKELIPLRLENRRLIEFTMLAMNRELLESGEFQITQQGRLLLLFHIFRSVVDYMRTSTKVDTLVACFHPKHDAFYKVIAMTQLGGLKFFGKVKGSPAMARCGRFEEGFAEGRKNTGIRLFFGDLPAVTPYQDRLVFSENDLRTLFVEHSNILASADEAQLKFIQRHYPHYNLQQLMQAKDLFAHLIESLERKIA